MCRGNSTSGKLINNSKEELIQVIHWVKKNMKIVSCIPSVY